MIPDVDEAAEVGWYPDDNPYLMRFWDGARWTGETAAREFGPPEPLPSLPRQPGATGGRRQSVRAAHSVPERDESRGPRALRAALVLAGVSLVALVALGAVVSLGRHIAVDVVGAGSDGAPPSRSTTSASEDGGKQKARRPFLTCAGAKRAGAAPLTAEHPRWNPDLDADGDGRACVP